jgi:hypothetical protein
MVTARLRQIVTLSPRRLAEQPLRSAIAVPAPIFRISSKRHIVVCKPLQWTQWPASGWVRQGPQGGEHVLTSLAVGTRGSGAGSGQWLPPGCPGDRQHGPSGRQVCRRLEADSSRVQRAHLTRSQTGND